MHAKFQDPGIILTYSHINLKLVVKVTPAAEVTPVYGILLLAQKNFILPKKLIFAEKTYFCSKKKSFFYHKNVFFSTESDFSMSARHLYLFKFLLITAE